MSSPKAKVRKPAKIPSTPPGTPPESPTLAYTTAAADTTAHKRDDEHVMGDSSSSDPISHFNKIKEMFRMKVSCFLSYMWVLSGRLLCWRARAMDMIESSAAKKCVDLTLT